jgi:hypothetical protein
MSYNYKEIRPYLFTEEGQLDFIKVRDKVKELLKSAGAFQIGNILSMSGLHGDAWQRIACVDRLLEIGEIKEIARDNCCGQYRVFVNPNE